MCMPECAATDHETAMSQRKQLFSLFWLTNLVMAKKRLLAIHATGAS